MVGEGLRCKITDFGMARDLGKDKIYVRRSNVSKHVPTNRYSECVLLPLTPPPHPTFQILYFSDLITLILVSQTYGS